MRAQQVVAGPAPVVVRRDNVRLGADLGGDEGRLILDFNFAYNPSCAYDPGWACPLAPAGNTLATPLLAGELLPAPGAASRDR